MVLALVSGIAAWVATIAALLQHKARWLVCSAVAYAIQTFLMMVGLAAYSVAYHNGTGQPSWSYHVGWIACVLSVACAVYYISVAIFRLRNPNVLPLPGQSKTYAPLAQFESTGTDEEEDEGM